MDYYYDFTRRVLLIMGIEVGDRSSYTTSMTFLRFYTPLQILSVSLQSLWYFLKTEGADYYSVIALATFIFCSQSSLKTWTIAVNQGKFKKLTDRLAVFYKEQTVEEKAKSSVYLLRIRSICKKVFVGQMISIWFFNLLPFVTILIALLQGNEVKYTFPYGFGWPFDPFDYFYPIFIYQLYAGQILMIGQIIMDEYFTLVVSDLVAHFDRFGDRLQIVISEASTRSIAVNRMKFRQIINQHNELLEIFEELNGLYSYALLYQILSGSLIICFILYLLLTQDPVYAVAMSLALINGLAQLYLPCWAGEMMKRGTIKLPDNIFYSDFYKMDKSLQKDLILMILVMQKPKLIRASKFFIMSLTGYASIMQTAFSYFTLLRRVFAK